MAPSHLVFAIGAVLSHYGVDAVAPFSYASAVGGCYPGSQGKAATFAPSLTSGDTAYVCININGKVTSLFLSLIHISKPTRPY